MQCAILSPAFKVREFSITDVVPFPITLRWKSTTEEGVGSVHLNRNFNVFLFCFCPEELLDFFQRVRGVLKESRCSIFQSHHLSQEGTI